MTNYDKHFVSRPGSMMERLQLWLTGERTAYEISRGMISNTPYPDEDLFFETILEHFAGTPPKYTIKRLKDHGMSEEQIKRLKKWWLDKGLREGWLETEYFEHDL